MHLKCGVIPIFSNQDQTLSHKTSSDKEQDMWELKINPGYHQCAKNITLMLREWGYR